MTSLLFLQAENIFQCFYFYIFCFCLVFFTMCCWQK